MSISSSKQSCGTQKGEIINEWISIRNWPLSRKFFLKARFGGKLLKTLVGGPRFEHLRLLCLLHFKLRCKSTAHLSDRHFPLNGVPRSLPRSYPMPWPLTGIQVCWTKSWTRAFMHKTTMKEKSKYDLGVGGCGFWVKMQGLVGCSSWRYAFFTTKDARLLD